MSYGKLPKACQDFALGIANVNGAIGNQSAQKTLLLTEHGSVQPVTIYQGVNIDEDPYNAWGSHNVPHIPRATLSLAPGASGGQPIVTLLDRLGNTVQQIFHPSIGVWQILMDQRLQLFFGHARAIFGVPSTDVSFCTCLCSDLNGVGQGLSVQCYTLAAGAFSLSDAFAFSVEIYSYS